MCGVAVAVGAPIDAVGIGGGAPSAGAYRTDAAEGASLPRTAPASPADPTRSTPAPAATAPAASLPGPSPVAPSVAASRSSARPADRMASARRLLPSPAAIRTAERVASTVPLRNLRPTARPHPDPVHLHPLHSCAGDSCAGHPGRDPDHSAHPEPKSRRHADADRGSLFDPDRRLVCGRHLDIRPGVDVAPGVRRTVVPAPARCSPRGHDDGRRRSRGRPVEGRDRPGRHRPDRGPPPRRGPRGPIR